MFLGEYQHSLDTKARITIPAKFRDQLGEKFIATKGFDNCIFLYPVNEWKIIEDRLRELPFTRADVRAFTRYFFSGASELEIDKQGRTVLPFNLRDHAVIDRDLVIIGVGSRIEIWAVEKWAEYNGAARTTYEQIAESLEIMGI